MAHMKIKIPTIYKEVLVDKSAQFKIFHSGRSAAKSWSFARAILALGTYAPLRVVCGRQYQKSIEDSVKELLDNQIELLGLSGFYKSQQRNIIGKNGAKITFIGLERMLGSIKGLEGVDIFWIEEGQYITQKSLDVLIPTITRNRGSELWISMNIDTEHDPCYTGFIKNKRPDSIVVETSFLDNPYVSEGTLRDAAWTQRHDPEKYNHIWLGQPISQSELLVFKNWSVGQQDMDGFDGPYFGMDFGVTDPCALIKLYVNKDKRQIYISDSVFKTELPMDGFPTFIQQVPDAWENFIVADSSRPETIRHINSKGGKILPSKKGPGSVFDGISFLQGFEITVHPKNDELIYEFGNYKWQVDKLTGLPKPKEPEDKNNHGIDAIRYAAEKIKLSGGSKLFI